MSVVASQPGGELNVQSALAYARRYVDAVDARVLLTALLECDAAHLIAHDDQSLTQGQALTYQAWVERRAKGEPVAYITGAREFYGRPFRVTPDVLIPRPETELLIDVALATLASLPAARVLDLGTGSGCIAVTLGAERAGARITAVDRSEAALEVARSNANRLGVAGIDWRASDWFEAVGNARYDLILANPPYIAEGDRHLEEGDLRYEPRGALAAGADGLDAIRHIVAAAAEYFARGGWLWFEHGYDQGARCREFLARRGYSAIATHRDLAGMERVTGGRAR